jgi:hypothetical protein
VLNDHTVPITSTQCGDAPGAVPNNVYGWGRVDVAVAVGAAQSIVGVLDGAVRGSDSAPLAGAEVEALLGPSYTRRTYASQSGLFGLTLLSNTYTVTVSHPGFVPAQVTGVQVTLGQTTTLTVTLTRFGMHTMYVPLVLR